MVDLAAAVDALDEAVSAASEVLSEAEMHPVVELAGAIRARHGYLGTTVLVALAGGTGSGKSSLLNALAGTAVSAVGAVRPTTAEPVAWIPANPEPGLVRLLDDLGLDRRVGHEHALDVAVIDLPDYDSVEFEHRVTVEALVPRVDAVIWVLDPQKYSDRALHRDYLIPLADYQEQFLFVLNQADRLDESGMAAVLEDLRGRLNREGFVAPRIITASAVPDPNRRSGIDGLVRMLEERFVAKQAVITKLTTDLERAHRMLEQLAGPAAAHSPGAEEQWERALRHAGDELAELVAGPEVTQAAVRVGERLAVSRAAGPVGRLGALLRRSRLGRALGAAPDTTDAGPWSSRPGFEGVLSGLSLAATDISRELGGSLGRRVRAELSPDRIEADVRASVEGALQSVGTMAAPGPRRWWGLVGLLQVLLFAAIVSGAVWIWIDGIDAGKVPWNLILVAGSLAIAAVLSRAARASGRRAGRTGARRFRAAVEDGLSDQLDARLTAGVAGVMEVRRRVGAALARLQAETQKPV